MGEEGERGKEDEERGMRQGGRGATREIVWGENKTQGGREGGREREREGGREHSR